MIISEQWLRELITTDLDAQQIADVLTLAGLEVDAVEPIGEGLENIVVGEVLSVEKHPDADKLNLTEVYIGGETLNIVCGASNVAPNIRVLVAKIGAELPNGLKIKKAKVRGVESFGMLCSASELGLEDESDGLMLLPENAPVGELAANYLDLNDTLIDIDLTPNRGDCLSMHGIAREMRVLADVDYIAPKNSAKPVNSRESVDVSIQEQECCPSYLARIITDVNAAQATPLWMQQRLLRSDVRPINIVVDITNYVMLELGQPMHAFDRSKIDSGINVRLAEPGEKVVLLDDSEHKLDANTLVIADAKTVHAIAGVMGGKDSGVDVSSTEIILEAAHFTRACVAGTARNYGLATDSSHRFERGVDPYLPEKAIERATELIVELCGGKVGAINNQTAKKHLKATPIVKLRFDRLQRLLGMPLESNQVDALLRRISSDVKNINGAWNVTAPSYRFDIERECDLVEEVARVMGYDKLDDKLPKMRSSATLPAESVVDTRRIKSSLLARGYSEAISYSFVGREILEDFSEDKEFIELQNPLAENMSVMRTSLWPGLLNACTFNVNRQRENVRLFEVGTVFKARENGNVSEVNMLAGLATGRVFSEHWSSHFDGKVDFYDIKSDLESVFSLTGGDNGFIFNSLRHKSLHSGQSASISFGSNDVGSLGKLHPNLAKKYNLSTELFLFEIDLDKAFVGNIPSFKTVSKYPVVVRDLAFVIQEQIVADELIKTIIDLNIDEVKKVTLFDVYSGRGVADGMKSLAIKLAFQHHSRTMTDAEIDPQITKVLGVLEQKYGAKLRG